MAATEGSKSFTGVRFLKRQSTLDHFFLPTDAGSRSNSINIDSDSDELPALPPSLPTETPKKKSRTVISHTHYDVKTDTITITPADKFDWTAVPSIFTLIHTEVVNSNYSFRKAAEKINAQYFPLVLPKEITHSTIQNWYQKVDPPRKYQLKPKFLKYLALNSSSDRSDAKGIGGKTIFHDYPGVQTEICMMLHQQRQAGVPLNSAIARELIYGYLKAIKFPLLDVEGGTFTVSRGWTRKFLRTVCLCSYRKSTKSAQHLPADWKNQIEVMIERIALLVEKFDVRKELIVNIDQTGVLLVPVSCFSYERTGSVDCAVVGKSQKRQFTVVMGVSAGNILLPLQLIHAGKSDSTRALPSPDAQAPLLRNGFRFYQTPSHWSSVDSHIQYINEILVPFYQNQCRELRIDYETQYFILIVDVWHRDRRFLDFMATQHPRIKLVFIPGGCTGEAQPCDVFIQRPFKSALLQQFSQWAANQVMIAIESGTPATEVKLDFSIGNLRDQSCKWIMAAWNKLQGMKSHMEAGWKEKCNITSRVFDQVFQLKSKVRWMENKWDADRIHIPMGKTRDPGSVAAAAAAPKRRAAQSREEESDDDSEVNDEEQAESGWIDDGEDEEETPEQVAAECLSDEMLAEVLQAEEDQLY
jgi:hypothetical protein